MNNFRMENSSEQELKPSHSLGVSQPIDGSTLLKAHRQRSPTVFAGQGDGTSLRVLAIDPESDPRWRAYVSLHPHALIYHHPFWVQVLRQTYGYKPAALACEDDCGTIRGILPLFQTHGLITGRKLVSLPHTPVAGPLADDAAATAALIRSAAECATAESRTRVELKLSSAVAADVIGRDICIPWEESYMLSLPQDPEKLRFGNSRNHARIRWSLNKAERLGVNIRIADNENDLRAWYQLYLETMRWHAVPPRSFHFFATAWAILRPAGMLRLVLAEQSRSEPRKLLAGSIFLMFGRTVFYGFNGRRRENLSLRPNDLIQSRAIQDACREGYQNYDFGEVGETNQGLAEFKTKWGALPQRYYRFYYPAPNRVATEVLREDSALHRMGKIIWRRLPLGATAECGRWIYRYL